MPPEHPNLARAPSLRLLLALGPGKEPPTSFRLWRMGENPTENGLVVVDDESVKSALEWAETWGNRLPVNYNHFGRRKEEREKVQNPAEAFKAAGSFRLGARPDGLWAEDVRWTPTARQKIRDEEYIYTSPEVWVDPQTGRLFIVDGCALTNEPATHHLTQLVASRAGSPNPTPPAGGSPPQQGDTHAMPIELKALLTHALLSADTPESEALGRVGDNARAARQLLSTTGAKTLDEAVGVVDGWKSAAAERDRLREELSRGEGEAVGSRMRLALEAAAKPDAKGRVQVSPAEKAWAEKEYGLSDPKKPPTKADEERLKGYLSTKTFATAEAATQPAPGGEQAPGTPPAGQGGQGGTARATYEGKVWADLPHKTLHALYETNRPLYDQLLREHKAAERRA